MSGPKGGGYVISAEVRQQRELARAREAGRVAEAELRAAIRDVREEQAHLDDLEVPIPAPLSAPPEDADIEDVRAYTDGLNALRANLRRDLAVAHRRRRGALVAAHLRDAGEVRDRITAADVLDDIPAHLEPTDQRQATLDRLLSRLRDDVGTTDLDAIEEAAHRLLDATTGPDERRWEADVRHRIDTANRTARQREQDHERARHLLADLRAIGHDVPPDLDAALVAVLEQGHELSDGLVERVRDTVRSAADAADARIVTEAVGDVLTELGYDVGESFDTVLMRDGRTHIRGQDERWRDHGVRVRLDPERRELVFHVVRAADRPQDAAQDRALELDWCEDLATVIDDIAHRDVGLTLTTATAAGAVPVPPIEREVLDAVSSPADTGQPMQETDARRRRDRRRRDRRRPKERGR